VWVIGAVAVGWVGVAVGALGRGGTGRGADAV